MDSCLSPFERLDELHEACYFGEIEKVQDIIIKAKKKQVNLPKYPTTYEADPLNCGACCFSEFTPLAIALISGHIEIVKLLLKEGARFDEEEMKKNEFCTNSWLGSEHLLFAKQKFQQNIPIKDSKTTKELERMSRERCWYEYDLDGTVKLFLAYQHGTLSCLPLDIIKYISKNFMMKRITF